ncbi:uncharacterized protein CMC5_057440 [Chondromyces crocatus]|uniref:HTH deoR-type domain-containing protein n=1 Tax=Chondromyces crocatus TaxID=52 RepID=A0A0K1ELI6_CHOCO|nr:uncharacterized protein CMC5_057440 [Chondromyces crocatus]
MNRVDRLLALIVFLQSRRFTTAEEMARHFGLSVRTIYRDLAALGEAGVPIAAEAGVGYTLMKGYHLPPVSFTVEEASALVTGGVLVAHFTDASLRAGMDAALLKIRATLSRDHQERVATLERNLGAYMGETPPSQADLGPLQQALAHRQVVRLHYRDGGKSEPTGRTVEPLGLVYCFARWHLIAWCRTQGDYHDFRTDRMRQVTVLDETFAPREGFHIEAFVRSKMPDTPTRARVKFAPLAAERAKREWWLGVVGEERIRTRRFSCDTECSASALASRSRSWPSAAACSVPRTATAPSRTKPAAFWKATSTQAVTSSTPPTTTSSASPRP